VEYPVFDLIFSKDKEIQKMYGQAMKELNDFFEIRWERNRPSIIIAPTRAALDKIAGRETPNWWIGMKLMGSPVVVLLAYETALKEKGNNIHTKKNFYQLTKHELCHCFTNIVAGSFHPRWISEGVSLYAANQLSNYKKPERFEGFFDDKNKNLYQESGYAVELLIEGYGRQELLKFLRLLKTKKAPDAFKEAYGLPLTYETFNELISKDNLPKV
jgi:hypothetical protein